MAARDSDDSVDFTDEGELAEVNSLVKKIFDILNRETSRVRKEKEAFDDVAKKLEHVHFSKTLCISQFHLRPAPPPPGYCGAFARLVSPGGGAFAIFALPGGREFANPRAIPELLTRMRFPIRI